jgi:hypothetical protein
MDAGGNDASGEAGAIACNVSNTLAVCPILSCACGSGKAVFAECVTGTCVTSCPTRGDMNGGNACYGYGCFCALGVCARSTGVCCSWQNTYNAPNGTGCRSDCDCISGFCNNFVCSP